MDRVGFPTLPSKLLTGARPRPIHKHTPDMAANDCRFVACSLYVRFVNIEVSSSQCAITDSAQPVLYKVDQRTCQDLSEKLFALASIASIKFALPSRELRKTNNGVEDPASSFLGPARKTQKAKRRNGFGPSRLFYLWSLSSPQQPLGWKDSPTI